MTKSLKSLWERFLFRDRGILPTKRLIILFAGITLLLFFGIVLGLPWIYIFLFNILVFLISLIDLFFSPKKKEITIERVVFNELERGIENTVQIKMRNRSNYSFYYRLVDGIPQSFQRSFPLEGTGEKLAETNVTYSFVPLERGKYVLDKFYLRYRSFIGLWEKQTTVHLPEFVKVIPDLTETKQFLENAQKFLLFEGVHIRKQHSGAGDFSKIRNYVVGDDPRKINWRQTAKLREVMTNDYEPEHGKYITILLDCGRMMGAELKKGNRLERSLEAAMSVTAAALQKGDYVSVLAFSKNVKVFVPPAKGMAHLQTILKAIYDLQVDASESNYGEVFQYLETVQKKRSLLLLFSDVRTFLHEESALIYLKRLRQRHLFFMVGVEDKTLVETAQLESHQVELAMLKSIAQQQLLFKKREKNKWEKQGLQMIEASEEKLAATAVSYYIEIMNQNLL